MTAASSLWRDVALGRADDHAFLGVLLAALRQVLEELRTRRERLVAQPALARLGRLAVCTLLRCTLLRLPHLLRWTPAGRALPTSGAPLRIVIPRSGAIDTVAPVVDALALLSIPIRRWSARKRLLLVNVVNTGARAGTHGFVVSHAVVE